MKLLPMTLKFGALSVIIGVALVIVFMGLGTATDSWSVTVYAVRDGADIQLIDTRTTLTTALVPDSSGFGEPVVSPDGRFVVRRGEGGYRLINRQTGWSQVLGDGGQASWAPDSSNFIYVQSDTLQRVWVSASNIRQESVSIPLQRSFGRINRIVWSPLGNAVAIEGMYRFGGETVDFEIYTLGLDNSQIINVSNDATVNDHNPVWSPDGRRLSFVSERHGNPELYLVDLQQGGLLRLTEHTSRDSSPMWSPDGQQIAFVSYRDGEIGGGLYLLDLTDPYLPILSEALAFGVREDTLVWSPDGSQIAFVAIVDGDTGVYMIDLVTNRLQNIADVSRSRAVMLFP